MGQTDENLPVARLTQRRQSMELLVTRRRATRDFSRASCPKSTRLRGKPDLKNDRAALLFALDLSCERASGAVWNSGPTEGDLRARPLKPLWAHGPSYVPTAFRDEHSGFLVDVPVKETTCRSASMAELAAESQPGQSKVLTRRAASNSCK